MTHDERIAALERNLADLYAIVADQNSLMLLMSMRIAGLLARECNLSDEPSLPERGLTLAVH